jgi:uncharacterized protein (TIGR02118 family)
MDHEVQEQDPTRLEDARREQGALILVKWIVAFRYKIGESQDACQQYWLKRHATSTLDVAGLKHYVQSHRVRGEEDIGNAPYDGYESLWFENEAAAKQSLASPHMAALRSDAERFFESAGTKHFLAREILMRDAPADADSLKLVTFNYRKPGLPPPAFQDYWENRHGPLVLRHFAALRRYVQNHALPGSYDAGAEPDFDGILEAWLASFDALRAGEGTPEHEAVRADEANFLDADRFRFMLVRDTIFR